MDSDSEVDDALFDEAEQAAIRQAAAEDRVVQAVDFTKTPLTIVQGGPGAGKSTQVPPALLELGRPVVATIPTVHGATHVLPAKIKEAGLPAFVCTFQMMVQALNYASARNKKGMRPVSISHRPAWLSVLSAIKKGRAIVWVDEGTQVSTRANVQRREGPPYAIGCNVFCRWIGPRWTIWIRY